MPGRSVGEGRLAVPGPVPIPGRAAVPGRFPRFGTLVSGRTLGRDAIPELPVPGRLAGVEGKFGRGLPVEGPEGRVEGVKPPLGRLPDGRDTCPPTLGLPGD